MRYQDGVRGYDFDANLGPYPHELDGQWKELIRHATADLVERIEPVSKVIRAKRAEYDAGEDQNVSQADQDSQTKQNTSGSNANGNADDDMADVEADEETEAAMDTSA